MNRRRACRSGPCRAPGRSRPFVQAPGSILVRDGAFSDMSHATLSENVGGPLNGGAGALFHSDAQTRRTIVPLRAAVSPFSRAQTRATADSHEQACLGKPPRE